MTNLNYNAMTEQELREYVRRNPQDEDAFQHYLSITRSRSNSFLCTTDEHFEAELLKRVNRLGT